jgi:hypothetical protein|tara:strand:- start:395 stop:586 length:192 start_codon:yes stop_codon:yes gene_type:complete
MTTEDKEQRRKRINRKKQDNVHNIYAKDLRTPKYKMRVVPGKKNTQPEGNLLKKVRDGEYLDE